MRDPNRIDPILNKLREIWKQQPDMRLGQLLVLMARPANPCPDLFHIEDRQLESRIDNYASALDAGVHKLRYVRQRCDESRSVEHSWGASWRNFEIDALNNVIRQIEVYDAGPTIGYDSKRAQDELGCLVQSPLDRVVEDYEPMTAGSFNELWSQRSNRK